MRKLTLLLFVILVWLQYSLWLGKNGVRDLVRLKDDVKAHQVNTHHLKVRNKQIFTEVDDLSGGKEAIEEHSRNDLGMIKLGETFYRFIPRN